MSSSWTCPFCKRPTTITNEDMVGDDVQCLLKSDIGKVSVLVRYTVCPNEKCKRLSLFVALFSLKPKTAGYGYELDQPKHVWHLIPESTAKVYSDAIVPKVILEDYEEACKIVDKSPKASATLSRRALQGMIRDFWGIIRPKSHKGKWTLYHEIQAIKNSIDPDVWEAIDAVRKIGNIGAHMEEEINLIIEVKPDEANKLIELIELLIEEWYINRFERKQRLVDIKKIAIDKETEKKSSKINDYL